MIQSVIKPKKIDRFFYNFFKRYLGIISFLWLDDFLSDTHSFHYKFLCQNMHEPFLTIVEYLKSTEFPEYGYI